MLSTLELIALSVSALETELKTNEYPQEGLAVAIEAERNDQNRKTAIEALEGAFFAAEPEPEVYRMPKGKSMTTKAGIKSEGQEVTAGMVVGGDATLKTLKEKGLLV